MKDQFIKTTSSNLRSRKRIKDISIIILKIRSEFYARLRSLLDTDPEISSEGFEFFIKDTQTGFEFGAGLTGFGPGYFSVNDSTESKEIVNSFHDRLFKEFSNLKECKLEIINDYGKTILGYNNGDFIELDIED